MLDVDNKALAMLVASKLYEQGKLSLGQAAELAGLTKRTFAELLRSFEVSIFNSPVSDLSRYIKMPKTIISDTSCLNILHNIGELEILKKVYGTVVITKEIAT